MKLIDLSMPIWEGAGYAEILAMPNTPVQFMEYMYYEEHGLRRSMLKIDDETGSPLMTPYQGLPRSRGGLAALTGMLFDWTLDQIPLERQILADTVVLDVPGGDHHEITAEEIDAAVAEADYRPGDNVLVRTGWATTEKAFELGDRYCIVGPSWTYEGCVRMAEVLDEKGGGIFMTDTPLIMTSAFQGWGWSTGEERLTPKPKPWPSVEARERRMDLPPGSNWPVMPERIGKGGYRVLVIKTIGVAKCLVNANQITQGRIKMIIMPLLVKRGGAASCRFIAVEE